jgi:MDMPI-like protein
LATLSAPASDLLLLLWRRVSPSGPTVETGGDVELAGRFLALTDLD